MSPASSIGFYVHHHGRGHAMRTMQLADQWRGTRAVHVLTSAPGYLAEWAGGRVHELPPDVAKTRNPELDLLTEGIFHYAPTTVASIPARMAKISRFIAEHQPAVMIVDLSVEITQFCRLCGVPTVSVRLNGQRNDSAHLEAWRNSHALIAPFPPEMDDAHTPQWVRDKTIYLGAYSRYTDRSRKDAGPTIDLLSKKRQSGKRLVLVTIGSGGSRHALDYWREVAEVQQNLQWWLVGDSPDLPTDSLPDNLSVFGHQPDTYPYLALADVVIGSGGSNTVFEVGAVGKPFCCLPETRPYDEQLHKAKALERLGLAVVLGSLPDVVEDWSGILEKTLQLDPIKWRKYFPVGGLRNAYQQLEDSLNAKSTYYE